MNISTIRNYLRSMRMVLRRERLSNIAWLKWHLPFELVNLAMSLLTYYYYAVTFGAESPFLKPYGGNFMAFFLLGLSLNTFLTYSLTGPPNLIRRLYMGRMGVFGTFISAADYYELANVPVMLYLVTELLYGFFQNLVYSAFYLIFGIIFLGFSIKLPADYIGLLIILSLGILASLGIGLISASMIWIADIWYGQEPIQWFLSLLSNLISGVYFPPEVLPSFLQILAFMLPQTHTLRIIRLIILRGVAMRELVLEVILLVAESALLMTLGLILFKHSLKIAKRKGGLIR